MKRLAVFVLLALLGSFPNARATSSLSFEGGGYWIDLEIGADQAEVVATVRFHAPGDAEGVVVPRDRWHVESFDSGRQVLELRHPAATAGVAPFALSVRQRTAVLTIGERRIEATFDWQQ